jgi:hypothetical protein
MVLALVLMAPAVGLAADVFDVEWAQLTIFTRPDLTNGTPMICVVWADEPNITDRIECSSNGTSAAVGSFTWYPQANQTGFDPHAYFQAELQGQGHSVVDRWMVGAKRVAPPPGNLKVAVTSHKANSPACCTPAVNIWVEGAAPGTNTFTLAVDGKTIATQNCGCGGLPGTRSSTPTAPIR